MAIQRVLLVGLGNYTHPNTRHNVGMMVMDAIASALDLQWSTNRPWKAQVAQTTFPDYHLTLLKPQRLMNVSGSCVAKAVHDLGIPSAQLYVFHDDLQRQLGKLSLKQGGSANGHNGIKSVIQCLGSNDFARVRIGIGRPDDGDRSSEFVANYVLGKFTPAETTILKESVYPIMGVGPGLGLETLCRRGQLWVKPKPSRPKQLKKPATPTPSPSISTSTTTPKSTAETDTHPVLPKELPVR